MNDKLNEIEVHLAEIKHDLKYHIKRTDELEKMVAPTYKVYVFFNYLLKALVPISLIVGIILSLRKP